MYPSRSSLLLIYSVAFLSGALAAFVIWRRQAKASRPLALMVLGAAFWALCDALELSVTSVGAKRLISQIQYVSVVSVAPLFLHSAIALSRLEKYLTRAVLFAVWGVPVVSLGIAWTSQWHHWLWRRISVPDPVSNAGVYEYGWWFWVLAVQSYILLAIGTVILLKTARRVLPPFRVPMLLVLIAISLPWIGNVAYNLKLGPWPGVNWLSISLTVSGILLAWSTLHGGLLDLLPGAREALVECMSDAVMVLDRSGRVLLRNSSAVPLLNRGQDASLLEKVDHEMSALHSDTWQGELQFAVGGSSKWLEVRATPVLDRWLEVAGRLLVIRDITAQKELQREKENLISELRAALNQVKTLEGLLPICAGCKKIRDDHGYWTHVESYFVEHAHVRFTHSLCPDCMKKYLAK